MTYQPPQPPQQPYPPQCQPPYVAGQPEQQPGPYGPPPFGGVMQPAPRRRRVPVVLLVILFVLGLILVIGLAGALLSGGTDDKAAPKATTTTAAAAAPVVEATTAEPIAPKASDFKLTPKIVEKNCYGSAGCSITLRVDVAMEVLPDDDASWLVVYEIRGVEDGPEVGNLTITGDRVESTEEHVSTASSKSKITIKVTSVEPA